MKEIIIRIKDSLVYEGFLCLISSKTYFFGTFAKNYALIIKPPGGILIGGTFINSMKGLLGPLEFGLSRTALSMRCAICF